MHDFFGSEQKKAFWKLKQKIIFDMVIFDDLGNWKNAGISSRFLKFYVIWRLPNRHNHNSYIRLKKIVLNYLFEMQYLDIKQLTSICYKYTCKFKKK